MGKINFNAFSSKIFHVFRLNCAFFCRNFLATVQSCKKGEKLYLNQKYRIRNNFSWKLNLIILLSDCFICVVILWITLAWFIFIDSRCDVLSQCMLGIDNYCVMSVTVEWPVTTVFGRWSKHWHLVNILSDPGKFNAHSCRVEKLESK